jgi:hypothetical protein
LETGRNFLRFYHERLTEAILDGCRIDWREVSGRIGEPGGDSWSPASALTRTPVFRETRVMADLDPSTRQVTFKTVLGFPSFMVGDDGSVWQYDGGQWGKAKISADNSGYLFVVLRRKETRKKIAVHRLILETFVSPAPIGMVGCHAPDCDPTNNDISNLRWDTHSENGIDKGRYGYRRKFQKAGYTVTNYNKVQEKVRRMAAWPWRKVSEQRILEIQNQDVAGICLLKIAENNQLPLAQVCDILGIECDHVKDFDFLE